ncbi:MAG: Gfo/Idh/MocA family oxidoreductase [Abitibacteriaceae bacterium]|nr:Gfo/Idh/MocA family oxidoreductase [Abditibacteriaceae bacterium]MBV9864329.1 Gfo/Idh/MocA family oxidoreductase [Abditibacteriaceae bacterium]
MADFRVGLLGCGGIANAHAKNLQALESTDIVAVCDVAAERAADFNQRYADGKAIVYSDFTHMFDKEKLDVVWICLPPFAHSNEVELAAERGVHVFIEKPIALDIETGRRMVQAVEKAGIKSQVGFMSRFGEAVEPVKEMIDNGQAGAPGWALGVYRCNALHAPWWRDKSKSGGQVLEQIIHTYDIIRYFLGDPASAFCFMDNLFHQDVENYTAEDVSAASLKFKNGAVASVAGTNAAIPGRWQNSFSLVCRNLTVEFADANHATLHYTGEDPVRSETIEGDKNLMLAETTDLLNAIQSNGTTRTSMSEGAKTLELVLAVSQSGETGQVVQL